MEKTTKKALIVGGVAIAALLLIGGRKTVQVLSGETGPVYNPLNPSTFVFEGQNPQFSTVNNIDIDPSKFSSLAQEYMPLFGMIGGTGEGGYTQVNAYAAVALVSQQTQGANAARAPSVETYVLNRPTYISANQSDAERGAVNFNLGQLPAGTYEILARGNQALWLANFDRTRMGWVSTRASPWRMNG